MKKILRAIALCLGLAGCATPNIKHISSNPIPCYIEACNNKATALRNYGISLLEAEDRFRLCMGTNGDETLDYEAQAVRKGESVCIYIQPKAFVGEYVGLRR